MPYRESQNLNLPSRSIQLRDEDQWAIQDAERRERRQQETRIFLWLLLGMPALTILILGLCAAIFFLFLS